ncbi:MAG: alpha-2-macroglobulin family protein, partial [Planctomycetota bacterium]
VHHVSRRTDDYGGLDAEFTLGEEPPLGVYRIQVHGERYVGGQNFRVEEYKKPEFEVTVEPDTTHAKLGEKINAVIRADYYFGAPVTEATVKYRVFREEYTHAYYFPGPWDWLYGQGYGYSWYASDWFPWWGQVRCCWEPPPWWWGYQPPSRVRELVKEGETAIGQDGTVKVQIDTAPALRDHPDRDHRYVIEAEVRDASRRVITGQGGVKVTRQAFYALIQSDRGYYRPGEEMVITLRCVTPDNRPVETDGVLTVSRVVFGGPDNAHIEETELERIQVATDERGLYTLRMRHERSDQLKFKFAAPDQWGGSVEGYGLVWVCGRDFDGRLYRFNDLELLTDKRSYRPGETCHLMINVRRPRSYVLFADKVDAGSLLSYRLLRLSGGHTIVDVPIEEGDAPNFFVEAVTVSDLRIHQQVKRICVPPEERVVQVDVAPDKVEYRPGEEATVRVSARMPDGEPAQVQVVLSTFDKSVLYVQEEYTPPIAKFFHGRLRYHHPSMSTNLLEQFAAWGDLRRPFEYLHPLPPAWTGTWGVTVRDWASISNEEFQSLRGGSGGAPGWAAREESFAADAVSGPMMAEARAGAPALSKAGGAPAEGEAAQPAFAEAEVRREFADTALWVADAVTGPDGEATVRFEMPENLTTWKINAWAMGKQTRVGQASSEAVTTKDLLVRLQAPRFFMEYDEVVISANVHNYLATDKTVRVALDVPEEHLELMAQTPGVRDVSVPAGGERRVDWRVKVLREGRAAVTVRALSDEESDAMQMTFPVLVHGITKQDSYCGSVRPAEVKATRTIELLVPERRRPELTRLEVQFAPSLVGAMMDALPYCLDYPYGCTEQTVSRFLPAVLTLHTLQNMGIDLEEVRRIRGRLAEVRRVEAGEQRRIYADSPIFDSDKMHELITKGLDRIRQMQHGDGGWAWWKRGDSSGYLTGYVLHALVSAQQADVAVEEAMIGRGMQFLRNWEIGQMRKKHWRPHATHAFAAYVLSMKGLEAKDKEAGDCVERLYEGRDKLGLYGKALLSMAMANLGQEERARIVLRNIMQYLQENPETEIAWFRTPRSGWWYWYNNDIETNAWCLRALVRLEPESDAAPRIVKWLLENRRNGYYWRSTRDTALCVAAMSEFARASGEADADYTLTIDLDDGALRKKVHISSENLLTAENRFVVEGPQLGAGKHTLTISKVGPGALYYSAYLRYFTKEEDIKASGLQLKLDRTYYLLRQIPYEVEVEGAEGQKLTERRLRYERIPLKEGDRVESGDLIQVELRVTADNDYTYLVFEDMKPAGCEPTEVRSGGKGQEGFWSYMELRDEKVAFFANSIARGDHLLRYRLRAEIPGVFHALPAVVQGMYVPELRGNSDEAIVRVLDR